MPGPNAPQRVTLLYRGVRLGAELLALLGEERQIDVINSPIKLAKGRPPADVVVIDVPAQDRRAACEQVRRHHRGRLIVLLGLGDSSHDLPPDHNRTVLTRPFSMHQLSAALAVSTPTRPTSDPAGVLRLALARGAQTGRTEPTPGAGPGTVAPAVPRPARSWRERRLMRVSAISITAALLFMGAFALVNKSGRCGPGCDELTGADLTSPSSTTVGAVGAGAYTADPGIGVVGSTTTASSVDPTADEGSGSDGATSSPARISATTAWSSGAPTPTSSKDPSRSQPSAPSTIASTTTKPRAPTTTAPTTTTPTTTTITTTTGP